MLGSAVAAPNLLYVMKRTFPTPFFKLELPLQPHNQTL